MLPPWKRLGLHFDNYSNNIIEKLTYCEFLTHFLTLSQSVVLWAQFYFGIFFKERIHFGTQLDMWSRQVTLPLCILVLFFFFNALRPGAVSRNLKVPFNSKILILCFCRKQKSLKHFVNLKLFPPQHFFWKL